MYIYNKLYIYNIYTPDVSRRVLFFVKNGSVPFKNSLACYVCVYNYV